MTRFGTFVDSIVTALPVDRREPVSAELLDHLSQAFERGVSMGHDPETAAERATASLGKPSRLRRQLLVAEWKRMIVSAMSALLTGLAFGLLNSVAHILLTTNGVNRPTWRWILSALNVTPLVVLFILAKSHRVPWRAVIRLGSLYVLVYAAGRGVQFAMLLSMTQRLTPSTLASFMYPVIAALGFFETLSLPLLSRRFGGRIVSLREAMVLSFVMVGLSLLGWIPYLFVWSETSIYVAILALNAVWTFAYLTIWVRLAPIRPEPATAAAA